MNALTAENREAPHLTPLVAERIATPALILDADAVDGNIAATVGLLGGDPGRWRPHLKTAKLLWTMRRLVGAGVRRAKCTTTLELETACAAGFEDVILSYPLVGPGVEQARQIAARYPGARISALVEDSEMVGAWQGSGVALFVDLNPGMDRTGLPLDAAPVCQTIRAIQAARLRFGGLHYYDGHASSFPTGEVEQRVHRGYDQLLALALKLKSDGVEIPEIVTAGTPAFPAALTYRNLVAAGFVQRLSPGTAMYCDVRSLEQLPADVGYRAAVTVLSRVVSHPTATRFTCDAGHKTVSADAGDPTCAVVEHTDWAPRHPSEEHLPVDVPTGTPLPPRGTLLQLVPQHVCPTVNNFDHAVIVKDGCVQGLESVTARGRHAPMG